MINQIATSTLPIRMDASQLRLPAGARGNPTHPRRVALLSCPNTWTRCYNRPHVV